MSKVVLLQILAGGPARGVAECSARVELGVRVGGRLGDGEWEELLRTCESRGWVTREERDPVTDDRLVCLTESGRKVLEP